MTNQTMAASDVQQRWSQVLARVRHGDVRLVIEESGVPVAGVISAEDLARLERYDAEQAARFAILDRVRQAFSEVPDDELERQVVRALAEARATETADEKSSSAEQ